MKKLLVAFFLIFSMVLPVNADTTKVLNGGVSVQEVPKDFFGMWRVSSDLISTNTQGVFKTHGVDFWNISRKDNIMYLENPFSGAKASISICELKGSYIKFEKDGNFDGQKLTDKVAITLSKNTFTGINKLKLDTFSDYDNKIIKSNVATYKLTGEKISGTGLK